MVRDPRLRQDDEPQTELVHAAYSPSMQKIPPAIKPLALGGCFLGSYSREPIRTSAFKRPAGMLQPP